MGRGFLGSSRLGRGPGVVDFSSELLDLASQRGKGRVKGGAEEPKLLLGEGRGSGRFSVKAIGKADQREERRAVQHGLRTAEVAGGDPDDPIVAPVGINTFLEGGEQCGEVKDERMRIHSRDGGGKRKRRCALSFWICITCVRAAEPSGCIRNSSVAGCPLWVPSSAFSAVAIASLSDTVGVWSADPAS